MSAPLLTLRGLTAGYGGVPAAADVSFTLERGEILCIVGESGCGKSTLLKAIQGVSPGPEILSGALLLGDADLTSLPLRERRRLCAARMGMVYQSPGAAFDPIRSYRRQFIETLKSHGKYSPAEFRDRAGDTLARLGLEDPKRALDACPWELSGGMNQRMAMALALLLDQELLLADEPTSALDATVQLQTASELKALRDRGDMGQILVTHDLGLARYLADRIGVMYAGRLVELGPAEAVLREPRHPYTRALTAAVPGLDGRLPQALPGQPPSEGPGTGGCPFLPRCGEAEAACAHASCALLPAGEGHCTACVRKGGKAG